MTPRRRWTAAEWEEASLVLYRRSGGRCEHCGKPLHGQGERHHRQRRRVGGDRYANLLLVLPGCHSDIHAHPEHARANGWIVSAYEQDPALLPVAIAEHWWLLDDRGFRRPAP